MIEEILNGRALANINKNVINFEINESCILRVFHQTITKKITDFKLDKTESYLC